MMQKFIIIFYKFITILFCYLQTPLVGLFNKSKQLLFGLVFVYLFTRVFVISMTDIAFPYRDDTYGFPTPQRHYISVNFNEIY